MERFFEQKGLVPYVRSALEFLRMKKEQGVKDILLRNTGDAMLEQMAWIAYFSELYPGQPGVGSDSLARRQYLFLY